MCGFWLLKMLDNDFLFFFKSRIRKVNVKCDINFSVLCLFVMLCNLKLKEGGLGVY